MTVARPDHHFISGTFNYRDVGGLRTESAARVRSGVLLRSAHLCRLDTDGLDTLRKLGVSTVHDLRGHDEIQHLGEDLVPDGVRLEITPFDARIGRTPPHEVDHGDPRDEILQAYRAFPTLPEAGVAIAEIARSLVHGNGATLVHCAAGKDRTGWAIATLLRAVGVAETEILEDFLLSNEAVDSLRADVAQNSEGGVALPHEVLGVDTEYLAVGTNSMHRMYGDLETYLSAIGVTGELRTRLHDRLLE